MPLERSRLQFALALTLVQIVPFVVQLLAGLADVATFIYPKARVEFILMIFHHMVRGSCGKNGQRYLHSRTLDPASTYRKVPMTDRESLRSTNIGTRLP